MQNISKNKVTVTVRHSDNKIMSVFSSIEHCRFHPLLQQNGIFPYETLNTTEMQMKRNPHDLDDGHH